MSGAKLTLFVTGLLLLFAVGISIAWVRDVQSKSLVGTISDEQTQQPVAGATVRITQNQTTHETQSDDAGHYRIGVGDAPLTITVQARGYLTTIGPFTPNDALVKDFLVNVVVRPYVVSGVVKDSATQKPIIYAAISSGDAQTQSSDDGRYTLARAQPSATLRIDASGYYPHEFQWKGESNVDFVLTARTLAIQVSSAQDSKPLRASVLVGGAKYQTDATGRITIKEPETNTKISASLDDYATSEATYTGQAVVDLVLKPSAFHAVVKNAKTSKPVAGALVYVNGVATLTTSDEGKFGLAELTAGTTLKLKAAGFTLGAATIGTESNIEIPMTPFNARGVYLPFGLLANEARVRSMMDLVDRTELNTLVVDVKGDRGKLAFHSDNPIIKSMKTDEVTMDLGKLLQLAHQKKIYVIARIVTFKDDPLTKLHPEWAVHSKSGAVWHDGENLGWANPYLKPVWDYNIAIAKEVAALGFDEIQFDYIRFPSDGDVNSIYFVPPHTPETRAATLRSFLNAVNDALRPYAVFISADIFGMTVWTHDDMGIGQRLEEIAQRVDYVQPMVYPSTFAHDNLGYHNPSLYPYEVIFRSVKSAAQRVNTLVRPWLQGYSSRDVAYGASQFLAQKRGANDAGAAGWVFWNSSGVYDASVFAGN